MQQMILRAKEGGLQKPEKFQILPTCKLNKNVRSVILFVLQQHVLGCAFSQLQNRQGIEWASVLIR